MRRKCDKCKVGVIKEVPQKRFGKSKSVAATQAEGKTSAKKVRKEGKKNVSDAEVHICELKWCHGERS